MGQDLLVLCQKILETQLKSTGNVWDWLDSVQEELAISGSERMRAELSFIPQVPFLVTEERWAVPQDGTYMSQLIVLIFLDMIRLI